jgi:SAM-dependent methyltransferase
MSKDFYNEVYQADHSSQYGGGEDGMPQRSAKLIKDTSVWLDQTGLAQQPDAKILEIGCGMAFVARIHPGWHGAEYSKTAVARVKERDGQAAKIFEEDAQCLSFESGSFDGVFSWAALEHVPDPNKAFLEVDRILRGGGYGLLAPAWNCRSWTVKKIEQRTMLELSLLERIERWSIPLRELLVVRAGMALPKRIYQEIKLAFGIKTVPLRYKALQPRWDLIERYGHVSDDDAVADIDLHAGICFFKSRGYEIISHSFLLSRLIARHEPLIVRKPIA